jgi:hypothetical protein
MLTSLGGTPSGARTCRGLPGTSSYAYSRRLRLDRVLAGLIVAVTAAALEERALAQASPASTAPPTGALAPAPAPTAPAAPGTTAPVGAPAAAPTAPAPPGTTGPAPVAAPPAVPPAPATAWSASQAPAAPPASTTPAPAPEEWRGWQTLAVDLAGVAAGIGVAASVDSDASKLGLFTATWYGVGVVGAPAVHHANRRWPVGIADFAVRALFPPVVGVSGLLVSCVYNDEFDRGCARSGWSGGMLFGLAGAAAFDALLLSRSSERDSPGPGGSWYGLQILTIDVIAFGVGAFYAMKAPREGHDRPHPGLALWVMDYLIGSIGAPIVHFAHSNVGLGFASLGMRLFLSPMGAVIGLMGVCAATAGSDDCAGEGAQYGLFGGSLAIALFDAFALARESEDRATASNFDVTVGAGSIGLRGSW